MVLVSMWGCGGGESGASGSSVGVECHDDGWVKSFFVAPFSWGVPVGLTSVSEISVRFSSSVWVKISLGE